jgi:hypothetical protein
VEFTVVTDDLGRTKAGRVTGPDGSFVQGAPRRQPGFYDQPGSFGGFDSGGFGGGGGGGGFGSPSSGGPGYDDFNFDRPKDEFETFGQDVEGSLEEGLDADLKDDDEFGASDASEEPEAGPFDGDMDVAETTEEAKEETK